MAKQKENEKRKEARVFLHHYPGLHQWIKDGANRERRTIPAHIELLLEGIRKQENGK